MISNKMGGGQERCGPGRPASLISHFDCFIVARSGGTSTKMGFQTGISTKGGEHVAKGMGMKKEKKKPKKKK